MTRAGIDSQNLPVTYTAFRTHAGPKYFSRKSAKRKGRLDCYLTEMSA